MAVHTINNFSPVNGSSEWEAKKLSYFTGIASLLLSIIAITGNTLICLAVILNPSRNLRTSFNFFLVNLAVSDLMVGAVTLPISVMIHFQEAYGPEISQNNRILHMSFFASTTVSVFSLATLSIDRYIAIRWPMIYRKNLNSTRSFAISVLIWAGSVSITFIYFRKGYLNYLIIFANGTLLITTGVLVFTYVAVYQAMRIQEKEFGPDIPTEDRRRDRRVSISLEARHRKVTRVFLITLAVFLLTNFPATIMIYFIRFCKNCDGKLLRVFSDLQLLFVMSASAINPFVCTLRLPAFRKAVQELSFVKFFGKKNLLKCYPKVLCMRKKIYHVHQIDCFSVYVDEAHSNTDQLPRERFRFSSSM